MEIDPRGPRFSALITTVVLAEVDEDTTAYDKGHELLGLPNGKNHDGSWTEYGSLVGVPIELGDR